MEIDLHGYHPSDIVWNGVLAKIVQQAWEMGERRLCLIHGHWTQSRNYAGICEYEHRLLRASDSPYFAPRKGTAEMDSSHHALLRQSWNNQRSPKMEPVPYTK